MKALTGTITVFLVFANLCGAGRSQPLSIQTSPVDLHSEDDQINRVGRLKFQGGLDLKSNDARFGGISGLAASADGRRLSAVTDKGDWLYFSPRISPTGRLTGVEKAQIGDLLNPKGKTLRRKRDSDAESLSRIDGGFAITFERRHRVWLYRGTHNPFRARPTEFPLLSFPGKMRRNKGLEASARLGDGRLLVLAEDFPKKASFAWGWVLGDGQWRGFRYRRRASFRPTGAVTLPDGRLLVLERRFSYIGGFGTRLVAVHPSSIRPRADITGRELARLDHPLVTANFEGITSHRTDSGEVVLYLISDDNFNSLQRTILLKFALDG